MKITLNCVTSTDDLVQVEVEAKFSHGEIDSVIFVSTGRDVPEDFVELHWDEIEEALNEQRSEARYDAMVDRYESRMED